MKFPFYFDDAYVDGDDDCDIYFISFSKVTDDLKMLTITEKTIIPHSLKEKTIIEWNIEESKISEEELLKQNHLEVSEEEFIEHELNFTNRLDK